MKINKLLLLAFLPIFISGCGGNAINTESSSGGETTSESGDPAHEHTFSDEWSHDATHHWHAATCGHDVTSGKAEHSFGDWVIDDPAAVDHEGHKYRECSVCHYQDEETIEQLDRVIDTIALTSTYHPRADEYVPPAPIESPDEDLEITSQKWEEKIDSTWEDFSGSYFQEEHTYALVLTFAIKATVSHRVFAETVTCTFNEEPIQQVSESETTRTYRLAFPEVPSNTVKQIHVTVPEKPLKNAIVSSSDGQVDDAVYSEVDAYWMVQSGSWTRAEEGAAFLNGRYYTFRFDITLDSEHTFPEGWYQIDCYYRLPGKEYNTSIATLRIEDSTHGYAEIYYSTPSDYYIYECNYKYVMVPRDGMTPSYTNNKITDSTTATYGSSYIGSKAVVTSSYYEVYENGEWSKLTTAFELNKHYRCVFNYDNTSSYTSYFYNRNSTFQIVMNEDPSLIIDATSVTNAGVEDPYSYNWKKITVIFDYGVLSTSKKISTYNMLMPKMPVNGNRPGAYDVDSVTFDNDKIIKRYVVSGQGYLSNWFWYTESGTEMTSSNKFVTGQRYYLQFTIYPKVWEGYYFPEDAVGTLNTDQGNIIVVSKISYSGSCSRAENQQITIRTPLVTAVAA